MSSRTLTLLLATGLAATIAAGCSSRPSDNPKDYVAEIAAARAAKDESFRTQSDPVPEARRGELLPLAYFPIDPDYRVGAALTPSSDSTILSMPTSTGGIRQMRRVGSLDFSLKGQPMSLTAFVEVGASLDRLFVPFSDLTSGTETYAAGRYLELDRSVSGIYEVDFNRAFFPYCYYNASYECPYPPAENRLKVPIRAGERIKKT